MRYSDEKLVVIDKKLHKKLKQRAIDKDTTIKALLNKILEEALVGN